MPGIRIDAHFGGQRPVGPCPLGGRWRKLRWQLVRCSSCEHLFDDLAQTPGLKVGKLADKNHVDQVLGPGSGVAPPVAAGIRMELFGQVLLERSGWDMGRLDSGEVEKIRSGQLLGWLEVSLLDTDVDQELLE